MTIPEKDKEIIQATFKGNDVLLETMRKVFFGFDLSDGDIALLKTTFSNPAVKEAVRRKLIPNFVDTANLPIGVCADFWLDVEKEILGASSSAIYQRVMSKQGVLDMANKAMSLLDNPVEKMDLSFTPSAVDEWQVKLLTRSLYIRTVGSCLSMLYTIANMKDETPKQVEEKKIKNSSK